MNSVHLINRMALSPDPIGWFKRMRRRQELASVQPIDEPSVVTVRPYGIRKGLGMTQFPQDYTLMHYGGTLRGKKIGEWRESLMVAPDPQPVNAPTQYSWRSSQVIHRFGNQWIPDFDEM